MNNNKEENIWFEKLNIGWDADCGAPVDKCTVDGKNVILEFYISSSNFDTKARITFYNCKFFTKGWPDDENSHTYIKNKFNKEMEEVAPYDFYLIHNCKMNEEDESTIKIVNDSNEKMNYYFFLFHDDTFQCMASTYEIEFILDNN